MDALHPRLLVTDFAAAYAFYAAVLPELAGAELAAGGPTGPYASWDVNGEGLLSMFDAKLMAAAVGVDVPAGAQNAVMLVCRVADVDAGTKACLEHGATVVAPPADRPQWGPNLRTAHLRTPDGALMELQSY
ncbi:MAG: glyoxalase/bleomycin resistance/extradiol dioxygenase family protein [Hamadaea sp.]|uniref:VOC family protein n=1 Tax=Hamadaea sp. TaxID=2024425 RepID=UPI001827878C|nr:VOC family protein [Hamadaea sp.]NUR71678.1 glyoxalase/bleomycin resistance/extradiol dioxygenase family protein [Hamadaea sp.]NUT18170.1 glyoxalase/bleomycin resistance/extradiol dioxygenase family protein [Hamadaea sp.]